MKKLLLTFLMAISFSLIARADDVDTKLFYYVSGGQMTSTSVSKSMLSMVSPEVLKKLPLLGSVKEIESIGIYSTAGCGLDKDAEYQVFYMINNACVSPILSSKMDKLLELKDQGSDYTVLYGLKNKGSEDYSRIILITYGKKGCQLLNFEGNITAEVLSKIAASAAR